MEFVELTEKLDLFFAIDCDGLQEALSVSTHVMCYLVDSCSSISIGGLMFSTDSTGVSVVSEEDVEKTGPMKPIKSKRTKATPVNKQPAKLRKSDKNVDIGQRKDIQTALTDLNLLPEFDFADRACSMCSYVAKAKGSLRIHYQLKHFGGAGLIQDCKLCPAKVKTKGGIKKHYMRKHDLPEHTAIKYTWSDN